MRWDCYKATIPALPHEIVQGIREALTTGTVTAMEEGPGFHSYRRSDIGRDYFGSEVFRVMSGGKNPLPHVVVQGAYSPRVAEAIRERWPTHRVSRLDSAYDASSPGLFDDLVGQFQRFANRRELAWDNRGDWRPDDLRDPLKGRTFYVGSRTSLALLRVYEKGKQLLPDTRPNDEPPDLDWVRIELEVKPQDGRQKDRLCTITPQQAWGVSNWTREALHLLTGAAPERIIMWQPRETDAYRAVRHMARQYRESIGIVAEGEGGMNGFVQFLQQAWADQDNPAPPRNPSPQTASV